MRAFPALKQNLPFFLLIVLAFLTRFLFLSYPSEVVFDEVHFGKFVFAYFSGEYYFDIHPPLGKMLIAGFYGIFGQNFNFDFAQIGETFNAKNLFVLRFLPAFFGALFVVLIYKLALAFGLSKKTAFFCSFLIIFENAILVESKFLLTDIFLLFFGFCSLYFWILGNSKIEKKPFLKSKKNYFYLASGIFAALSFSVKWTGLSFLGIILFFSFLEILKKFNFKKIIEKAVFFVLVPFFVYLLVFFIHFELLPKSGPGSAYMSVAFQKGLLGNNITEEIKSPSFFGKFLELNKAMYSYSAGLKATHPNASYFYQWPIAKKPIWYWSKKIDNKSANIYLFGNPLIWWLVAIFIPISIILSQVKKLNRLVSPTFNLLIFGFFINLLPYIFVKRVTFLYHYLPSLVFGILILALFLEKISFVWRKNLSWKFLIGFLSLVLMIFLIFSPLSYGFPVPEKINLYYLKIMAFFN